MKDYKSEIISYWLGCLSHCLMLVLKYKRSSLVDERKDLVCRVFRNCPEKINKE